MEEEAPDLIPQEIVFLILKLSDTSTVHKCKLVCKSWLFFAMEILQSRIYPRLVTIIGTEGQSDQLRFPGGLAYDSHQELLYVSDTFNNRIQAFYVASRRTGKQEDGLNWPPLEISWHGQEMCRSPETIVVDREGRVLVLESSNSGNKINILRQGHFIESRNLTCMALDPKEETFFVLGVNDRVSAYEYNSGTPMRKTLSWGSSGSGTTDLNRPQGLAIDKASGWIYIADTENHRVQVFMPEGVFLFQWGLKGVWGGRFQFPTDISIDEEGHVFVADSQNHRVQVFDRKGNVLCAWGKEGSAGKCFKCPRRLCVAVIDGNRYLFVSDRENHRVQVFQY